MYKGKSRESERERKRRKKGTEEREREKEADKQIREPVVKSMSHFNIATEICCANSVLIEFNS